MFALCDQRSFYASCESVFKPALRHKPVAVLSNNDGCIVALNEYAKNAGVKKFEPYFKQRLLIQEKGVHVFSSNYALYDEISWRIMNILQSECERVEIYSIDEAFCDFSDFESCLIKDVAKHMKNRVWIEQRIPMGVSIAPTKTLAKLGQYATKKIKKIDGICFLEKEFQWQWLAKKTPVEEVWGVGRQLAKGLRKMQVNTVYDLMSLPLDTARGIGHMPLERTVKELNGESCIPLEIEEDPRQGICSAKSFGEKVTSKDALKSAIVNYISRAAEKLRAQDLVAGQITVFIQTSRFEPDAFSDQVRETIPGATQDTRILAAIATDMIDRLFVKGYRYAKAGVALTKLAPCHYQQPDLFVSTNDNAIMKVVDDINAKYGRGKAGLARHVRPSGYAMKQNNLSPSYLTQWGDIPKIKCKD